MADRAPVHREFISHDVHEPLAIIVGGDLGHLLLQDDVLGYFVDQIYT